MNRWLCLLLLSSLVIMAAAPGWAQDNERLKVGDIIPGFYVTDLKGEGFFLKDHLGENPKLKNKGILFSFCASTCKPCIKEIPEIEKLYKKYIDKGLLFYLINVGERKRVAAKFRGELGTSIPMLVDRYNKALEKMGRPALPHTVLIDDKGIVTFVNTGYSEKTADDIISKLDKTLEDLAGADSGDSTE